MFIIECEQHDFSDICKAMEGEYSADCDICCEVVLVDEREILRLNSQIRNIQKVTDVLSFPSLEDIRGKKLCIKDYPYDSEEGKLFIGSIAVCEKRAAEQAEEYGHSYERELYYLVTHGIMHLLGYDHMAEEDKAEMRRKEEAVLSKLNLKRNV